MPLFGAALHKVRTPSRDKSPFRVCRLPRVETQQLRFTQIFHNDLTKLRYPMEVSGRHQSRVYVSIAQLGYWNAQRIHFEVVACFP
jgi:hypothetical protein